MFQNSGTIVQHFGDEEDQIVFWGEDVDPRDIIVLKKDYGDHAWTVMGNRKVGKYNEEFPVFATDKFEEAERWVMANFNQYRKVLTRR